jgi:predicted CoA-binding protein
MKLDERMLRMLRETETIATVGFSTKPYKPSHYVPRYMMEQGYRVIPVHPEADEILGEKSYTNLRDIPEEVDLVQLFRPSDQVPPHVDEAVEIGADFIWMQLGINHKEAAARARQAGLEVIEDRCMMVEHRRLRSEI